VACRTTPTAPRAAPAARDWRRVTLDVGDDDDRDLPDLYVRPGAIVPLGPDLEWTGQRPLDPLELLVCLGPDGRAVGWLYEDAATAGASRRGRSG